jgi:N-acetyl-anhydromuramyl-L-alanine amidase AmpD
MNITKSRIWTQDELDRMGDISDMKYLVVHHTAGSDMSVNDIDVAHKNNGWVGVGYQYLIRTNGDIEKGRPDNKAGAQAEGFNSVSLGIALTGDFTSTVPTEAQMASLVDVLAELSSAYPAALVVKHSTLNATACPGASFPWIGLMDALNEKKEPPPVFTENWKLKLVDEAKAAGLITGDHDPDATASKWFVLRVALAVLDKVKK